MLWKSFATRPVCRTTATATNDFRWAITTRYLVDGEPREDVALYDVGYSISGRLLSGHTVTLRGLSLISRVTKGDAQKLLDARWAKLTPPSKRSPA